MGLALAADSARRCKIAAGRPLAAWPLPASIRQGRFWSWFAKMNMFMHNCTIDGTIADVCREVFWADALRYAISMNNIHIF